MKANELMIGDRVIAEVVVFPNTKKESKITQVTDILEDGINAYYSHGELEYYIVEDEIKPIPLTEEILDKNKHKRLSISRWGMPTLVIDGDRYMLGDFHFVHELQQALRLCGLNDLADNFKIV